MNEAVVIDEIRRAKDECEKVAPQLEVPPSTLIHTGPDSSLIYDAHNERIKIYGMDPSFTEEIVSHNAVPDLAGKVTVYAPSGQQSDWKAAGFEREAVIQSFYENNDAELWACYPQEERRENEKEDFHQEALDIALSKPVLVSPPALPEGYRSEVGNAQDSDQIADLLRQTFAEYPSSLDPSIIQEQIQSRANHFRMVYDDAGHLAAVASAEIDHERRSAELTDCATDKTFQGQGLMGYLLAQLETDLARMFRIKDLYTIARADEIGINCAFRKLGYDFSGRLVNNCRMPNGWESMNVWCKESLTGANS